MIERISREELVRIYKIEITFFDSLEEAGLVTTIIEDEVKYLPYHELTGFERLMNWHYDLEVNMPGLEVINHLLLQIENLQAEKRNLKNNSTEYF